MKFASKGKDKFGRKKKGKYINQKTLLKIGHEKKYITLSLKALEITILINLRWERKKKKEGDR